MDNKIEEIVKVLEKYSSINYGYNTISTYHFPTIARGICQQFPKSADNPDGYEPRSIPPDSTTDVALGIDKPKPNENILVVKGTEHTEEFAKPDERLLTEGGKVVKAVAKAQLAKCDAECQTRLERIKNGIEALVIKNLYHRLKLFPWWQEFWKNLTMGG